jgi:nitrate reductase (NAD(P)H)
VEDDGNKENKSSEQDEKKTGNQEHSSTDRDKEENGDKPDGTAEKSKHSSQLVAMFEAFKQKKDYYATLEQNDGNMISPVSKHSPLLTIDEADQFTPDNWI